MKSLAWIAAEHAELARTAARKRAASIRRLKARVHRAAGLGAALSLADQRARHRINAAIDAWSEAEKRRG